MALRTPIVLGTNLHEPIPPGDEIDPAFIDIGVTGVNGATVTEPTPNNFVVDASDVQTLIDSLQEQIDNLQAQVDAFTVLGSEYITVTEAPAGTFTVSFDTVEFCADDPCGA